MYSLILFALTYLTGFINGFLFGGVNPGVELNRRIANYFGAQEPTLEGGGQVALYPTAALVLILSLTPIVIVGAFFALGLKERDEFLRPLLYVSIGVHVPSVLVMIAIGHSITAQWLIGSFVFCFCLGVAGMGLARGWCSLTGKKGGVRSPVLEPTLKS